MGTLTVLYTLVTKPHLCKTQSIIYSSPYPVYSHSKISLNEIHDPIPSGISSEPHLHTVNYWAYTINSTK
jgi:hypothetical protein